MRLVPYQKTAYRNFAENLITEAFPIEERPPFEVLVNRPSDFYHLLIVVNDATTQPLGLLSYCDVADFVFVEHFAIAEPLRNQGVGYEAFQKFMQSQSKQIILEAEPDTDPISHRRLDFYKRLGMHVNSQPYRQPSYHGDKTSIPLLILSLTPLNDQQFTQVRDSIYEKIYKTNISEL